MPPPPFLTCSSTVSASGWTSSRFGPVVPLVPAASSVWQLPHALVKTAAPSAPPSVVVVAAVVVGEALSESSSSPPQAAAATMKMATRTTATIQTRARILGVTCRAYRRFAAKGTVFPRRLLRERRRHTYPREGDGN